MRVPVYTRRVISPGGSMQNINLAAAQYQAISDTANILERQAVARRTQKEKSMETQIRTEMLMWGNNKSAELQQNPDTYDTWQQTYKDEYNKTLENKIKDLRPGFQQQVRDWAAMDNARGQVLISNQANQVGVANAVATMTTTLDNLQQEAIRHPNQMGAFSEEAKRAIQEQRELGHIDAKQAQKLDNTFVYNIHEGIIGKNIYEFDPWAEYKRLKSRSYEHLTEERRTYWMNQAEAEIARRLAKVRKDAEQANNWDIVERHLAAKMSMASNKDTNKAFDDWYLNKWKPSIMSKAGMQYMNEPVSLAALPADQVINQISGFVSTIGYAPKAMQDELKAALVGPNQQQRYNAARIIAEIHNANPAAYDNISQDQIAIAHQLNGLRVAGGTPQEVATWTKEILSVPEDIKKTRKNTYRDEEYTKHNLDYLKDFDWVSGKVPDSLKTQYEDAVNAHYTRTGDITLARKLAGMQVNRHWGYSEFANQTMEYPPEKVFSPHEKDTSWLNTRWQETSKAIFDALPKDRKDYYETVLNRPLTPADFHIRSDATVGKKMGEIGYPIVGPDGSDIMNEYGTSARWLPKYEGTKQYYKSLSDQKIMDQRKKTQVKYGDMLRSEKPDITGDYTEYDTQKENDYYKELRKLQNMEEMQRRQFETKLDPVGSPWH